MKNLLRYPGVYVDDDARATARRAWHFLYCENCGRAASFQRVTQTGRYCGACFIDALAAQESTTNQPTPSPYEHDETLPPGALQDPDPAPDTTAPTLDTDTPIPNRDASPPPEYFLVTHIPDDAPPELLHALGTYVANMLYETDSYLLHDLGKRVAADPGKWLRRPVSGVIQAHLDAAGFEALPDPGGPSSMDVHPLHGDERPRLGYIHGRIQKVTEDIDPETLDGSILIEPNEQANTDLAAFYERIVAPTMRYADGHPPKSGEALAKYIVSVLYTTTYPSFMSIMDMLYERMHGDATSLNTATIDDDSDHDS